MKMKTTVRLRAAADCPSRALSNIKIRDLEFAIDEPVERGGTNLGPTPTDTVLAALIGCTNVIGHKCAESLGIDIGLLEISAMCEFDRRGVTLSDEIEVPFQRIVLTILTSGKATSAELKTLQDEVTKYCPVSKLFRNSGTVVEEIWKKRVE